MTAEKIDRVLDELGFESGSVSEIIVTTVNPDGSPNAAPMGVRRTGPDTIHIMPYRTSSTYRNLRERLRACINVTSSPALFLVTAFKEEVLDDFPRVSIDGGLRLASSEAHVFVEVVEEGDASGIRACFMCRVISVEVRRTSPSAFSRGRAEAIEAVIHATRIQAFMGGCEPGRVETLIRLFDECKDVVGRTSAPSSEEARVVRELERMIGTWREEASG
jgi:hypothetical protein